jgi:hypothetical protein
MILYSFLPIENSTSTTPFWLLIEFSKLGLLILRNGLPNKPKHKASNMVDLPAPLWPTINVLGDLSNLISVKLLPVDKMFFHRRV